MNRDILPKNSGKGNFLLDSEKLQVLEDALEILKQEFNFQLSNVKTLKKDIDNLEEKIKEVKKK